MSWPRLWLWWGSGNDIQVGSDGSPRLRTVRNDRIATATCTVAAPPLLPHQPHEQAQHEDQGYLLGDGEEAANTLSSLSASGSPQSGQQTSAVCASFAGPDGSETGTYTEAIHAKPMRPTPGASKLSIATVLIYRSKAQY